MKLIAQITLASVLGLIKGVAAQVGQKQIW